jgi:hypothetical protein
VAATGGIVVKAMDTQGGVIRCRVGQCVQVRGIERISYPLRQYLPHRHCRTCERPEMPSMPRKRRVWRWQTTARESWVLVPVGRCTLLHTMPAGLLRQQCHILPEYGKRMQ